MGTDGVSMRHLETVRDWENFCRAHWRRLISLTTTLAICWAGFVSCGSSTPAVTLKAEEDLPYGVVARGSIPSSGRLKKPEGYVFCSQKAVRRFASAQPYPLSRALLATRLGPSCVVAAIAGARPNTGYRIDVRRLYLEGRRLALIGVVGRPDGALAGQAISRPYVLLGLPRESVVEAPAGVRLHLSA